MAIEEGATLPEVELTAPDDTRIKLRDYVGKPLVVYFYPKDDTPGCTREAQEFGEALPTFDALGCALLGISQDKPAKHQKFIAKYDLAVPLASDEDGTVLAAFGTWIEKQLYGKTYMGIDRSTFLFGADGKLFRAWRRVRVPGHVIDVLESIKEMQAR